jgi:hypothetical protein
MRTDQLNAVKDNINVENRQCHLLKYVALISLQWVSSSLCYNLSLHDTIKIMSFRRLAIQSDIKKLRFSKSVKSLFS